MSVSDLMIHTVKVMGVTFIEGRSMAQKRRYVGVTRTFLARVMPGNTFSREQLEREGFQLEFMIWCLTNPNVGLSDRIIIPQGYICRPRPIKNAQGFGTFFQFTALAHADDNQSSKGSQ